MAQSLDGSELLTGPEAGGLLRSAVANAGGTLRSWELDHVDHRPGRSTKALYRTQVSWPELDGPAAAPREELFGASAHIGEPEKDLLRTEQSLVMTDGRIAVRVWRYPDDPWLPMLARVCYPDVVAATLEELGVPTGLAPGASASLEVISYRPGRRAVLRVQLPDRAVYLKVMQPHRSGEIVERHRHLLSAGVPVPVVLAHHEGLVVLAELPGRPLARAILEEGAAACRGEDLVALLDRLPASLYPSPLRAPWTDSASFYAGIIASSMPALAPRLDALVTGIRSGLAAVDQRIGLHPHDVAHGDFYEAQVFVDGGTVVGLLDIDTVGPGRRADDLACLLAHLSVLADYGTTGRIPPEVHERVADATARWTTVFAARVDPQELAVRAAGVVLSLATGPHRQQESAWESATEAIVRVAETWMAQAREIGSASGRVRRIPPRPATHPDAQFAPVPAAPSERIAARPPVPAAGPDSPGDRDAPTLQRPASAAHRSEREETEGLRVTAGSPGSQGSQGSPAGTVA